MASIHVIWDPDDKIRVPVNDEPMKKLGARVAFLQGDDLSRREVEEVITTLIKQLWKVVDG